MGKFTYDDSKAEWLHLPTLKRVLDDPFENFGFDANTKFGRFKPRIRFLDEDSRDTGDRASRYDGPRIRYFRDKFKAGARVDPVWLEVTSEGRVYIKNGYHRMCGAILADVEFIRVEAQTYSPQARVVLDKLRRITRDKRRAMC